VNPEIQRLARFTGYTVSVTQPDTLVAKEPAGVAFINRFHQPAPIVSGIDPDMYECFDLSTLWGGDSSVS
jgi:hypothetical protein